MRPLWPGFRFVFKFVDLSVAVVPPAGEPGELQVWSQVHGRQAIDGEGLALKAARLPRLLGPTKWGLQPRHIGRGGAVILPPQVEESVGQKKTGPHGDPARKRSLQVLKCTRSGSLHFPQSLRKVHTKCWTE